MSDSCIGLSCEPIKGNFKQEEWCTKHQCQFESFNGFKKCPQCNWQQQLGFTETLGVTETLSVCQHGNPINFGRCLICYPLSKPDPIKELRNRIESLHEFKLRQCDENKEIKKRIEEVINLFVKGESVLEDDIIKLQQSREAHSRNHKDIFDRLDNLEKLYQSSTEMESHLLNRVKDLEKFQDLTYLQYHNRKGKNPYKCPVCDGKRHLPNGLKFEEVYGTTLKTISECEVCEGK